MTSATDPSLRRIRSALLIVVAAAGAACWSKLAQDGVGFNCSQDTDCKSGLTCFASRCVADGGPTAVLVGASSIACDPNELDAGIPKGYCRDADTAELVRAAKPDFIVPIGNLQRFDATETKFNQVYMKSWGAPDLRAKTFPAGGVREYQVSGAPGFFAIFPELRNYPPGRGFYSFEAGTWHVVILNTGSNCSDPSIGGCDAASPQAEWLRQDLKDHPTKCTLAVMHWPLFNSEGSSQLSRPFWDILYDGGTDVVLSGGNTFHYERFRALAPSGEEDPDGGIVSFLVGTGGVREPDSFGVPSPGPGSEVVGARMGVIELRLEPGRFKWDFLALPDLPFADQGTGYCH